MRSTVEDDASWLDSLEQTRWLEAVQQALRSSARVAEELELGRRSVMLTGARVDAPRGWGEGGEGATGACQGAGRQWRGGPDQGARKGAGLHV